MASRSRLANRYAIELAEAVLESPLFRLALDVIDCEHHTYSRATELASAVLEFCGVSSETSPDLENEPAAAAAGSAPSGLTQERQR